MPPAAQTADDIEKPHLVVVDDIFGGTFAQPAVTRLSDVWSDLLRLAEDSDSPLARKPAAVPLLDDMQGILEWD